MSVKQISTPLTREIAQSLRAGDEVLLNGVVYTARDAAHARLVDLIDKNEKLPIDIENAIIYYVGPTPAKPGQIIGSAGPTTSYRMDTYAPRLLDLGLRGMIGKGKRSQAVIDSMKQNGAVYFGAIGGAAALIAKTIVACEMVCYEDLGSEAIRKLTVKDFPATVVIDSFGNNLYEIGTQEYLKSTETPADRNQPPA
ncbi:MAG: Fe-S-containing hydro-lyase [Synergistaceae bacterium]|jgi:fumarate hydratase subunit beta|nr:Fe-S-containing hydro-lyase [Synergistaceae bacterium]